MIFTVEGNVGAGKTTILELLEKNPNTFISYEPVDDWMGCIPENSDKSLFELFYEDQKKYAFSFQMMALQSRFANLQKAIEENKDKIIICERSFLTDYEVFAKLNNQAGNISNVDLHVYKKWHSFFLNVLKPNIKGIIYLQTSPCVCKERIQKRNRKGEESFQDIYLEKLHTMHEEWLHEQKIAPMIIINGNNNGQDAISNIVNQINEFISNVVQGP
jgi:deoxyadenosine/deoxycytidine kinase